MSNKLVCVKCRTELRPFRIGTLVIEMASFGIYKVWNADTLKCPGCGIQVVGGFAEKPLRQDHWSKDFPEWIETLKKEYSTIVYDFERPQMD